MAHIGSWGLPDLGITEAIQNIFKPQAAYSAEGGSNLFGPVNAPTATSGPLTDTKTVPTPTNNLTGPAPTNYQTPQKAPQSSGSYNFNIGDFENYQGWDPTAAFNDWKAKGSPSPGGSVSGGSDPYAGLRSEISSGWDSYINQLNELIKNGLTGQKSNMEQIVGNQYQSGVGDLNVQQNQGLSNLQTESEQATQNQNKNLKDLSENIRNMFLSGNVFLGSRGAGDSSAANQYSYALTKLGNKARGDVTSQTAQIQAEIAKRVTTLKDVVGNEITKLAREKDNKVLEISNWFAEQQNALKERVAQAGLGKSQDLQNLTKGILDQALTRLNQVEQDSRSRQAMLQEWAVNQSKTIGELQNNLAQVASFDPQMPQVNQFSGTPTVSGGNYNMPINWSNNQSDEEKNKGLFV